MRQQLQQPIKEQRQFIDTVLQRQLTKSCQASLNAINTDLKNADKQIRELIQADDYLRELFDLLTTRRPDSMPEINNATATEVLIVTE